MNCLAFIERKCPKIQRLGHLRLVKLLKVRDIFSVATLCGAELKVRRLCAAGFISHQLDKKTLNCWVYLPLFILNCDGVKSVSFLKSLVK
jgi:hypothetical protein